MAMVILSALLPNKLRASRRMLSWHDLEFYELNNIRHHTALTMPTFCPAQLFPKGPVQLFAFQAINAEDQC